MENEIFDKTTGRKITDIEKNKYIASVFDEDDVQYFIDNKGNIYINDESGNKIFIKDEEKISYIRNIFKPNKIDIID